MCVPSVTIAILSLYYSDHKNNVSRHLHTESQQITANSYGVKSWTKEPKTFESEKYYIWGVRRKWQNLG